MRILIDTHILVWQAEGDEKLPLEWRQIISDPSNSISISVVSFWEIAIKISRGKLSISKTIEEMIGAVELSNISVLPIRSSHTIQVSRLPFHHKDPFDRMIIAQSIVEDLPLMTLDGDLSPYKIELVS